MEDKYLETYEPVKYAFEDRGDIVPELNAMNMMTEVLDRLLHDDKDARVRAAEWVFNRESAEVQQ